jgi:hypothetical protein
MCRKCQTEGRYYEERSEDEEVGPRYAKAGIENEAGCDNCQDGCSHVAECLERDVARPCVGKHPYMKHTMDGRDLWSCCTHLGVRIYPERRWRLEGLEAAQAAKAVLGLPNDMEFSRERSESAATTG